MELGMYTRELKRQTVEELFSAIRKYGFSCVQWDFLSMYDEEMPLVVADDELIRLKAAADENKIIFSALSGTFNMAHADRNIRTDGLKRLEYMASMAKRLDCQLITLCSGSRSDNMWVIHEDNDTPEAWEDMLWTMRRAVDIAEKYDVQLGLEIEASNVVHTAKQARKLFDEIGSPRLGLIFDCANIFPHGEFAQEEIRAMIKEVVELFSGDILLAHGKDLKPMKEIHFTYAGNGIVDFNYFIEMLGSVGYNGPMILHGMKNESEFSKAVANIKDKLT